MQALANWEDELKHLQAHDERQRREEALLERVNELILLPTSVSPWSPTSKFREKGVSYYKRTRDGLTVYQSVKPGTGHTLYYFKSLSGRYQSLAGPAVASDISSGHWTSTDVCFGHTSSIPVQQSRVRRGVLHVKGWRPSCFSQQ